MVKIRGMSSRVERTDECMTAEMLDVGRPKTSPTSVAVVPSGKWDETAKKGQTRVESKVGRHKLRCDTETDACIDAPTSLVSVLAASSVSPGVN